MKLSELALFIESKFEEISADYELTPLSYYMPYLKREVMKFTNGHDNPVAIEKLITDAYNYWYY